MSLRPDDCAAILPLLEPWVDGELAPVEAERVCAHLALCPSCAAESRLAEAIQAGLRALPQLDAPPAVLERVRQAAGEGSVRTFRRQIRSRPSRRFAALAAALAVALLGVLLLFELRRATPQPTAREVARATEEARYALAYVGRVSRRAGLEIKDEVLPRHLVNPAARSLSRSLGETLDSANDTAPKQGS